MSELLHGFESMSWMLRFARLPVAGVLLLAMTAQPARADEVMLAVASNFARPLRDVVSAFERESGHEVVVTSGSTGQLYAQIVNGAPFDILLAADSERPRRLAEGDLAVQGTQRTYAVGRLAFWSRHAGLIGDGSLRRLMDLEFRWFAIAEPAIAPYGAAAADVLDALGIRTLIGTRLVKGQNIAQTFAMAETGTADFALVSLSQAIAYPGRSSYEVVPADLHAPIRQDLILLQRAAENAAALEFLDFIASPAAIALIERSGYSVPPERSLPVR